jgi:apolipoprotein N-acyltransferase
MLSFPENNLFWLTWIALVPLFVALMMVKNKWQAMLCGLLTGLFYFGGVLSWLTIIKLWIGADYSKLAWLGLTLFQSLYLVLFTAVFYYLYTRTKDQINKTVFEYYLPFLTSFLWIAFEWLRAQGPFGLPVGSLVYTQYQVISLLQLTAFFGPFIISFLIVFFNLAAARLVFYFICSKPEEQQSTILHLNEELKMDTSKERWKQLWTILLIAMFTLKLISFGGKISIGIHRSRANAQQNKLKVAIFQPNIRQEMKLDQKYYSYIKSVYINETKRFRSMNKVDLIYWPETIVPTLLLRDRFFIFRAKEAANTHLIFGTPTMDLGKFYNSIVMLDKFGREQAIYNKRHPVPFGEYLPFKKLLYRFFRDTAYFKSDYSFGKKEQRFETPLGNFASGICFESIMPQLIRSQVLAGGELISIITNDAWFRSTAALEEHLSMSVLRAIENRRFLIQAANTGYSAIIAPTGELIRQSKIEHQEWLTDEVALFTEHTFYTRHGDLIIYISWLIMLLNISWLLIVVVPKEKEPRGNNENTN